MMALCTSEFGKRVALMLSVHTTKQTKQNLKPKGCKETLRVVHMSIPLLVVMISLVFAYVQIHQIIHTKYVQFFSSVAQSCPTLCDPINCSTPGLAVHHQLPEFTQTHVLRVSDAIQPSHPLSSPSPLAPNPSQHQSLFQCVNSSHEMAKVLEFQL